jgi:hypothetical protein
VLLHAKLWSAKVSNVSIDIQTGMKTYQLVSTGMIFRRVVLHIKGAD